MNREYLLEFATKIELLKEDDHWQVIATLIECPRIGWPITDDDRAIMLRTLAGARCAGLSTLPLALALELGRRAVSNLWESGIAMNGPSDQLPTDFAGQWSIKLNGVRFGCARTLTLAVAAAICRLAATARERAMAADFLQQRQKAAADVAALQARLDRRGQSSRDLYPERP